jgi:hypothetical protein
MNISCLKFAYWVGLVLNHIDGTMALPHWHNNEVAPWIWRWPKWGKSKGKFSREFCLVNTNTFNSPFFSVGHQKGHMTVCRTLCGIKLNAHIFKSHIWECKCMVIRITNFFQWMKTTLTYLLTTLI